MEILLVGPPGAGKGTQGQRIAERFSLRHIAVGDLLRQAVADRTPLGNRANEFMRRGELVPDQIIVDVVVPLVMAAFDDNGFVLDGFPRSVIQADHAKRMFDDFLAARGESRERASAVIYLEVPRTELITRLLDRAGREGRSDDTIDVIASRLEVFDTATLPLVEHYRRLGRLRIVDGTGGPDSVTAAILNALGYSA
jgi:adenylate kinase